MDSEQMPSAALTGSTSRAKGPQLVLQSSLGVLAWLGFSALWVWQLEVNVPERWLDSLTVIGTIAGLWVIFTLGWVAWNRSIYRRRHRRNTPVRLEVGMDHDSLGRPIVASRWIRTAPGQILISVNGDGTKRYREAELSSKAMPTRGTTPTPLPTRGATPTALQRLIQGVLTHRNGRARRNGHPHRNGRPAWASRRSGIKR
jgi:hypothetical protein